MSNNYCQPHYSRTASGLGAGLVTASILASMCFPTPHPSADVTPHPFSHLNLSSYDTYATQPTFDQYRNALTRTFDVVSYDFEAKVTKFYSQLLMNQEPLGEKFAKILHENLWDLYED